MAFSKQLTCPAPGVKPDVMGQSGLTKTEADDLLDWLEANGCHHFELASVSTETFAVRWWN
jgi:hypothetical protein